MIEAEKRQKLVSDIEYEVVLALSKDSSFFAQTQITFTIRNFS